MRHSSAATKVLHGRAIQPVATIHAERLHVIGYLFQYVANQDIVSLEEKKKTFTLMFPSSIPVCCSENVFKAHIKLYLHSNNLSSSVQNDLPDTRQTG